MFSSSKSAVNPGLMASEVISCPAYVYHKVKYVKKVLTQMSLSKLLWSRMVTHHAKYFLFSGEAEADKNYQYLPLILSACE